MLEKFFQRKDDEDRNQQTSDDFMKPEADFYINGFIKIADLVKAHDEHTIVVGRVTQWDSVQKQLVVNLGGNLIGYIPLKEISVYNISFRENFSQGIAALVGNKVCCYVTEVDDQEGTCILSRKQSMLSAWESVKDCVDQNFNGYVTNISNFGAFVDVARGITGLVFKRDLTNTPIYNPDDIVKKRNHLCVKITASRNDYKLDLSHKACFGLLEENLKKYNFGDYVSGKVFKEICPDDPLDHKGFFVQINPLISGIVHIDYDQYVYGAEKKFIVTGRSDIGLKLKVIND